MAILAIRTSLILSDREGGGRRGREGEGGRRGREGEEGRRENGREGEREREGGEGERERGREGERERRIMLPYLATLSCTLCVYLQTQYDSTHPCRP